MTEKNKIEQIIKELGKPDDEFNKYHLDEGELRYLLHKACHNEAPTGEIGELIEWVDGAINYSSKLDGGSVIVDVLDDCKAQLLSHQSEITSLKSQIDFLDDELQQAQKMRSALLNIRNDINNFKSETIIRIIKQALNEGL